MKERNATLDYIRVFAMLCVVFYHFEVGCCVEEINCFSRLLTQYNNINFGGIGVFLFFMLSGHILHHKYKNGVNIHTFYKKRVLSIFPLYWITYLIAFGIEKIWYHNQFLGVASWKIILTILGVDGYFPKLTPTYYLVGEWFTPVIMCIYFLYPLIRYVVTKRKCLLIGLAIIDIVVLTNVFNPLNIVADGNVFIAITAFVIGSFLEECNHIYYRKFLLFVLPIWIFCIFTSQFIPSVILNLLVSISFYFCFLGSHRLLKRNSIIEIISKYSYGIYLTHHYVINKVLLYNNLLHNSMLLCFLVFICITVVYAYFVYSIEKVIKRLIHKRFIYVEGKVNGQKR